MQLPILGALFKSRDYSTSQTELMILVTPYIVRAGGAEGSVASRRRLRRRVRSIDRLPRPPEQDLRHPRQGRSERRSIAASMASSSIERATRRRSMPDKSAIIVRRRQRCARVATCCWPRLALSRLLHRRDDTAGCIPNDYRKRHPIAMQGRRAHRRGVHRQQPRLLTPTQRADVQRFRAGLEGEATGGIIIDVPAGTPNQIAASQARCARSARSCVAAGVPPHASQCAPISRKTRQTRDRAAEIFEDRRGSRPVRTVAARSRADRGPDLQREPQLLESRLRHSAQSRGHGRQPGRSRAAARRRPDLDPAPHRRCSTSIARARAPATDLSATKIAAS